MFSLQVWGFWALILFHPCWQMVHSGLNEGWAQQCLSLCCGVGGCLLEGCGLTPPSPLALTCFQIYCETVGTFLLSVSNLQWIFLKVIKDTCLLSLRLFHLKWIVCVLWHETQQNISNFHWSRFQGMPLRTFEWQSSGDMWRSMWRKFVLSICWDTWLMKHRPLPIPLNETKTLTLS